MMQYKKLIFALALSGLITNPALAFANDSTELEELRALVQELDQKVKILERKGEVVQEDTVAAKKTTPVVKASEKGFSIESADGKNSIKLGGLLQYDYRNYQKGANDVRNRSDQRAGDLNALGFHDANDTWVARRLRPDIRGTLFGKYDFRFQEEFAGGSASVVDAYADARFNPAFKVRVGKYKPFVGLERLQGGADIKFIERSYVSNDILPNRDQGISVYGDVLDNRLSYAFGVNNGVVDGGNASTGTEFDDKKEVTARIFATPFSNDVSILSGLGFGIAATYTDATAEKNLNFTDTSAADATRNGLPSYVTNGQNTFFRYSSNSISDGKRLRISPQAYYYYGPLGILAEYANVSQGVSLATGGSPAAGGSGSNTIITPRSHKELNNDAWQIAATYLITGEDSSFKSIKPKNDFDLDTGGWGAWELALRYSELNVDEDTFTNSLGVLSASAFADPTLSARKASSWTAGVNWYLNSNAKIVLNYEQTSFTGGSSAIIVPRFTTAANIKDRPDERSLFARLQLAF